MATTKNLCAQISLDLHQKISEAREQSGLTTAQYITNLLIEYYEMKKNGGNTTMANGKNRTLAFQIDETLFQRIKVHLSSPRFTPAMTRPAPSPRSGCAPLSAIWRTRG